MPVKSSSCATEKLSSPVRPWNFWQSLAARTRGRFSRRRSTSRPRPERFWANNTNLTTPIARLNFYPSGRFFGRHGIGVAISFPPVTVSAIFFRLVEEFPISTVDIQAPSLPPITPLGARTLSCHVAFWKPLAERETLAARRDSINRLLKSVVGFTHGLDRNRPFDLLETEWETIPVTFRVRLHEELISSLIYIHIDRAHNSANEIVSKLSEYFDAFADVAARGMCTCADWPSTCHKFLFEEVWARFLAAAKREYLHLPLSGLITHLSSQIRT